MTKICDFSQQFVSNCSIFFWVALQLRFVTISHNGSQIAVSLMALWLRSSSPLSLQDDILDKAWNKNTLIIKSFYDLDELVESIKNSCDRNCVIMPPWSIARMKEPVGLWNSSILMSNILYKYKLMIYQVILPRLQSYVKLLYQDYNLEIWSYMVN